MFKWLRRDGVWDELERAVKADRLAFRAWQKERLAKYPNEPNVDISRERWNVETDTP